MNQQEENFQKKVEAGIIDGSADSQVYERIFHALAKEPPIELSPGFASKVLVQIEERQVARTSRFELFLAVAGGLSCVVILLVAVLLTGFSLDLGFLEGLRGFKGVIFFGIGFVLLLNWMEKIFLSKKETV